MTQARDEAADERATRWIAATEDAVRRAMAGDASGHDFWHIDRVRRMALRLAEAEGAERLVVELAALLHDVDDWKLRPDPDAPSRLEAIVLEIEIPAALAARVRQVIDEVSFRGAGVATPVSTIEAAVVQDADRLDAIGAIGIARAFAFGGSRRRALYDPNVEPRVHGSFASYQKDEGTTLNHFYEKLLLLRARLNTRAARTIAEGRHAYLEGFVARFLAEWEGER
ncbi:MAG: HD domain-containing protein [Myxococcales bacterium]|nr:HD domain-containing protein [Myxococcales bacterium]